MQLAFSVMRVVASVRMDNADLVATCIAKLGISNSLLGKNEVPLSIFEGMLCGLVLAQGQATLCGASVFQWMLNNQRRLTGEMEKRLVQFVVENFQKYSEPVLLLYMAEWIGGRGDGLALSAIERWLMLSPDSEAFQHIGTAIDEFLRYTDNSTKELVERARQLQATFFSRRNY